MEKRLLQAAVMLACLVPLSAGIGGGLRGADLLNTVATPDLDSHIRYLSGLLLGIGIGFASTVPHIERHAARFRLLTLIVLLGGALRLLGLLYQTPGLPMQFALVMELVVTPLLCLWQHRLARRFMQ